MAKIKQTDHSKCWQKCGTTGTLTSAGGDGSGATTLQSSLAGSYEGKITLPCDHLGATDARVQQRLVQSCPHGSIHSKESEKPRAHAEGIAGHECICAMGSDSAGGGTVPCQVLWGQVPMWLGKGHTATFRSGVSCLEAVMEAGVQCFVQSHQIVLLK